MQGFHPEIQANALNNTKKHGFRYKEVTTTKKLDDYEPFVDKVLGKLRENEQVSTNPRSTQLDYLGFDIIAIRMAQGLLHFCSDPYYLTPARGRLVGVLPLGRVKSFGCAVTKDILDHLIKDKIENIIFEDGLLREIVKLQEQEKLQNCSIYLLGESAASSEVLPYLIEKSINRIQIAPSISQLKHWAKAEGQQSMVIADIDILKTIDKEVNFYLPFSNKLGHLAGFPYPLGDNQWRSAIERAVAEVLKDETVAIWDKVSEDLRVVGIEPLKGDELLRELLLDMNRIQARKWRQQLRGLLTPEPAEREETDG